MEAPSRPRMAEDGSGMKATVPVEVMLPWLVLKTHSPSHTSPGIIETMNGAVSSRVPHPTNISP